MAAIRALPPRRVPPPVRSNTSHKEDEAVADLSSRIASLNAGQITRAKYPPVVPRRTQAAARIPDLERLLARPPPPIPKRVMVGTQSTGTPNPQLPTPPEPSRRRLPPMPSRLPTPPPINFKSKPDVIIPVQGRQESCLKCRDFSQADEHAALFPRHTVSSLETLAYELTSPFPSEIDKARAVFTWLHHNVAYDTESFFSGNVQPATPTSTLKSGLAVCDGYAGLFKFLVECVGIQAHKVTGHGKGFGYQELAPGLPLPQYHAGHAWNCILADGEWMLIDPCWGAGAINGTTYNQRFAPNWFNSTPVEFGRRHFPEDPSYQLRSEEDGGPISWEEYITEREGPVIFGDFYELNLHVLALQPASKEILGGQYVQFTLFKECEHLSTADDENYVYIIVTPDSTRTPLVPNSENGWSANIFIPRGGGDVMLYSVKTFNGADGKGLGVQQFTELNGRRAMSFGGLAKWTVI